MALLIHGLNLRPERMSGIAEMLAKRGVECLNLSLSGHAAADPERLETFKSVSRNQWLGEARQAYQLARERADALGAPLLLVGFSLGAAIGGDLASGSPGEVHFDAMILFAPAFSIHWYTRMLRCLSPLPRLALKSFSPADYAANPVTPVAAYSALFQSIAAVRAQHARVTTGDALIFVDPKDELVSFRGLEALCAEQGGGRWQLVSVSKRLRSDRRDFHHLIIDEESLGPERWAEVAGRCNEFLADVKRSKQSESGGNDADRA